MKACFIGLGYIGLPTAIVAADKRPEAVDAGTVKFVGINYELIVTETSHLLDDQEFYNTMSQANNPYGDGQTCERIIEFVM